MSYVQCHPMRFARAFQLPKWVNLPKLLGETACRVCVRMLRKITNCRVLSKKTGNQTFVGAVKNGGTPWGLNKPHRNLEFTP